MSPHFLLASINICAGHRMVLDHSLIHSVSSLTEHFAAVRTAVLCPNNVFNAIMQSSPAAYRRGERYPNWFNSIFKFCQKMIQFNIQFNIISQKFNSKNYSIQKNVRKFNSKKHSIKKIQKNSIQLNHDKSWISHIFGYFRAL